jgi:membrane protein implicated in regulation of membrane protease activity
VLSIVVYAFAIWQALVGRWEVLVAVVAVYALTFAYFFHANRKARRARDEV